MNWPQRVIDQLGREPIVGDWVIPCCLEDLQQLRTANNLESFRRLVTDTYSGEQFYATLDEALAWAIPDIKGSGQFTDEEIAARVKDLRAGALQRFDVGHEIKLPERARSDHR